MSPRLGTAALACLVVGACQPAAEPQPPEATITVRVSLTGTAAAAVVVAVSAPDIPQPLIFNLGVAGGVATGVITVPAGSDRTITASAYDAGGVETHSGSVTVDIQPNATLTLNLTLDTLTDDIAIEITLGRVIITVSPSNPTVVAGATVVLMAEITDEHGTVVAGPARWASDNPAVALVDATGLVSTIAPGTATIAATFRGAAGYATVTATSGP